MNFSTIRTQTLLVPSWYYEISNTFSIFSKLKITISISYKNADESSRIAAVKYKPRIAANAGVNFVHKEIYSIETSVLKNIITDVNDVLTCRRDMLPGSAQASKG